MPTKTFKVEWAESKPTSTGKPRKMCTLSDETGAHFKGVTLWGDFPSWAEIGPGSTVQGDYKDDGKYRTLYPTRAPRASQDPTGGGMRGVAAAQAREGDRIEKAQENKSNSIKVASSMRDATVLMGALGYKFDTTEEMWEMHKLLRTRYIKEWDATEKSVDVPFKDGDSSTPRI